MSDKIGTIVAETCGELIRRGEREGEICGRSAKWRDIFHGEPLCALHAASAVRSENMERDELESIAKFPLVAVEIDDRADDCRDSEIEDRESARQDEYE